MERLMIDKQSGFTLMSLISSLGLFSLILSGSYELTRSTAMTLQAQKRSMQFETLIQKTEIALRRDCTNSMMGKQANGTSVLFGNDGTYAPPAGGGAGPKDILTFKANDWIGNTLDKLKVTKVSMTKGAQFSDTANEVRLLIEAELDGKPKSAEINLLATIDAATSKVIECNTLYNTQAASLEMSTREWTKDWTPGYIAKVMGNSMNIFAGPTATDPHPENIGRAADQTKLLTWQH